MATLSKWILVADDDARVREVWTDALTGAGYRVVTASTGREALELMRAAAPDLIVLDLRMPEMSGPAFLRVLQGAPDLQRIPVLIVSGFLDDEEPRASLGLNIIGRLEKPLRLAEFVSAVGAALTL